MLLRSLRLLSCAQYFDSAFYFGADTVRGGGITFANALAGVTHFERTAQCEYISAYRFHTNDPLVFDDASPSSRMSRFVIAAYWKPDFGHLAF